ncbi:MAG: recombination mediator RecR [Alphaproteobacteria bacterium]|nr:recombination mediator RecR [Alphaproteobacteria bacterium]
MLELDRLILLLSKLPGLGPRSARRAALFLLKRRESLMEPLAAALAETAAKVQPCSLCGNLDTADPCAICRDPRRDQGMICIVEDMADLWAIERSASYNGLYHVLGGTLSALDGIGPEDLRIEALVARVEKTKAREAILAMNATVEGQTTAHYILDRLAETGVKVTRLAHGVPVGGELDYLDDGTLSAALAARKLLTPD